MKNPLWLNKYLSVQLNQMMLGYQVAQVMQTGVLKVNISSYGRLQSILGQKVINAQIDAGGKARDVLGKIFNYFPQVRAEALDRCRESGNSKESLWMEVKPYYLPKRGWCVLHNGRDVMYSSGFLRDVQAEDEIAIFPPGR